MSGATNLAASVNARLQNVAKKRGDDFNLLLLRYGIERLLFRLSQSRYAEMFLLKGAMLFVIWDEKTHRPTRDLDLLGFGPSDASELVRVFQEVARLPVPDDGVAFDPASVQAEAIREDNVYGGVRLRLMGKMVTVEIPVQVDVGVGDAVTPVGDAFSWTQEKGDWDLERSEAPHNSAAGYRDVTELGASAGLRGSVVWLWLGFGG